jgi:hypothetical protein
MSKRKLGMMLALVGVALVAMIGPGSSAVAFFSRGLALDVSIKSPATLTARGAAVSVPLDVLCTSRRAFLDVQVTERVGSSIAQGEIGQQITCTHDIQTVSVTVPASGKAFKKGTAVVNASIEGCGFGTCGFENASANVSVTNAKKH